MTTTTTTTTTLAGTVRAKSSCARLILENSQRINVLFAARLAETTATTASDETSFEVHAVVTQERPLSADYIIRLQRYVDDICEEGCAAVAIAGEDSSYDSDFEGEPSPRSQHQDVSRTTSDTLAAEYAEYVQTSPPSPGYTARVEFALKLGYTEKLVQAALQKLGPAPAQNELLAELIKLGAQKATSVAGDGGVGPQEHEGGHDNNMADVSVATTQMTTAPSLTGAGVASTLRPIVIDGSNVAMSHGNKEIFSCRGIKICADWFKSRGHKDVTVFVPKWRKEAPRPDNPITDQEILGELEKERLLVFTPSRLVGGKRMVCYDDRYVLRLAAEVDGVVVSNDNYRDLCQESVEFRKVVEERILMYSFVNDRFMPPDDPLGRAGPTLDNFLRCAPKKGEAVPPPPPPCPYGKKCTYGNKCKYHHPERGPYPHKSVTERLSEHALRHMQAREGGLSLLDANKKQPLGRTRSNVPPPKDTANQHAIVAKSRSVDNVGSASLSSCQQQQYGENLHRKLQRQLTLNPNGSDPRLLRRYVTTPAPPQYNMATSATWDNHQHVTRIASAPDSYRPWPPTGAGCHRQQQQQQQQHQQQQHMMQRTSSCSDSQLNVWPPSPGQQLRSSFVHHQQQQEDARRRLHYHLAAIFPEEQVTQAMQIYPDETNPQKICAAILAMFPSK